MALAERTPHATWASSGAGDEAHAAVGQKYALLLLCFKVLHVFSGRVKGKGKARNRSAPRTSLQHLPGPWAPPSPLASLRAPPRVYSPHLISGNSAAPQCRYPAMGSTYAQGPRAAPVGSGRPEARPAAHATTQ